MHGSGISAAKAHIENGDDLTILSAYSVAFDLSLSEINTPDDSLNIEETEDAVSVEESTEARKKVKKITDTHTTITQLTLLHYAIYCQNLRAVQTLLEAGADLNLTCHVRVDTFTTFQGRLRGKWVNQGLGRQRTSMQHGEYDALRFAEAIVEDRAIAAVIEAHIKASAAAASAASVTSSGSSSDSDSDSASAAAASATGGAGAAAPAPALAAFVASPSSRSDTGSGADDATTDESDTETSDTESEYAP